MNKDTDYAIDKPEFSILVGKYKLDSTSKLQLNLPDSLINKTIVEFNSDSTFVLKNYPFHFWSQTIKDYKLINAKGIWSIDKNTDQCWVIPMTFEQTEIIGTGYVEQTKIYYFNSFRINRKMPPYEIYVVYHPFLAGGIILRKE